MRLPLALALLAAACAPPDDLSAPMGLGGKADGYDEFNQPEIPGTVLDRRLAALPTEGQPAHLPWTGWWWPFDHKNGEKEKNGIAARWLDGELSPAEKYDSAFPAGSGHGAALWELDRHASGDSWYGHCDGWAMASATTAEPMVSVLENGICFHPNDVKALLTEAFECDMSGQDVTLLGRECMDGAPSTDRDNRYVADGCRDVNAGLFHVVVANLLGRDHRGLFFDRQTTLEIWNYPMRSYRSKVGEPRKPTEDEKAHVARGTTRVAEVTTSIEYMRAHEPSMTRDHVVSTETYSYLLELDDDGLILGGEWQGSSKSNHPDALKVPGIDARPRHTPRECNNPHLDLDRVMALAARSARGTASECGASP